MLSSWVKCPICGQEDGEMSEVTLLTISPVPFKCKYCGTELECNVFHEPTFRTVMKPLK